MFGLLSSLIVFRDNTATATAAAAAANEEEEENDDEMHSRRMTLMIQ